MDIFLILIISLKPLWLERLKQIDSKLKNYKCFFTSMLEILGRASLMMGAETLHADKEPGQM